MIVCNPSVSPQSLIAGTRDIESASDLDLDLVRDLDLDLGLDCERDRDRDRGRDRDRERERERERERDRLLTPIFLVLDLDFRTLDADLGFLPLFFRP